MLINAWAIFGWLLFFLGTTFYKKKSTENSLFATEIFTPHPHPKSTMRSTVVTISEGMKDKKQTKTKVRVGFVVKSKVGDMEDNTRKGRSRSISKYIVLCIQAMVYKNKLLVQFKDDNKKDMCSCLLVF